MRRVICHFCIVKFIYITQLLLEVRETFCMLHFFRLNCIAIFFSIFQTTRFTDQRGCRVRRHHPMGIGGYITIGMDTLLLLHLEGRQVDRQSRLLHFSLSVCVAHCPLDSRHYVTRRYGGHSILHQSKLI